MDLGCIDMGCLEKRTNERKEALQEETARICFHVPYDNCQNKATREAAQPSVGALNKFSSQIKKPPHRKGSPINWFPRKKVDSYLKRKIKLLQEVGGMNSTLDETLGDSNPHYSKVLKEKMAVREAAQKAMETRKAAMVEASWCRILQAARIHSKVAEALLLEAERSASEAFEAAKAIGVIMYDMPDCPQKQYETETSSVNGGRLANHNVTASFETAFEVDKQVGAALKAAFIKLASCPTINKEEFKELLRKISENPDTGGEHISDLASEYESDTGSDFKSGLNCETVMNEFKPRNDKEKEVLENFSMTKLVDLMLERLRHLHEDELASLATIVATCGLSAALEAENDKQFGSISLTDRHTSSSYNNPRRISSFGFSRSKNVEQELPSLDKFLVKRMTRLEREVQEAKHARIKETVKDTNSLKGSSLSSAESVADLGSVLVKHSSKLEKEIEEAKRTGINLYEMNGKKLDRMQNRGAKTEVADVPLDKFLVRHMSKLEREVQEAKSRRNLEPMAHVLEASLCSDIEPVDKENVDSNKKLGKEVENRDGPVEQKSLGLKVEETEEIDNHSLEELLAKPVDRREREKMQASSLGNKSVSQHYQNRHKDASIEESESLDKVMVKHVSRLEKEKSEMGSEEETLVKVKRKAFDNRAEEGEGSLDQILVKHKSRLEKEKVAFAERSDDNQYKHVMSRQEVRERESQEAWGGISLGKNDGEVSLDQILVKHKSRLEKEKLDFAEKSDNEAKHVMSRREVRERELQKAWGGLSLGNSIRPHLSRLQRDKAAWLKAEKEEERRKDVEDVL